MSSSKSFKTINLVRKDILEGIYPTFIEQVRLFKTDIEEKKPSEMCLFCSLAGSFKIRCNSSRVQVTKADIFFLFPGHSYTIETHNDNYGDYILIGLNGPGFDIVMDLLELSEKKALLEGAANANVIRELTHINSYMSPLSISDSMNIVSAIYRVFASMLEQFATENWKKIPFDSAKIKYFGNWQEWPNPQGINNVECISVEEGAYTELYFHGTGIKVYGTTNFDCGIVGIYIDDVFATTIDTYSQRCYSKQLLYLNNKLTNDFHTIKLYNTGNSNSKSIGITLSIESFWCLDHEINDAKTIAAKNEATSNAVKIVIEYIQLHYKENITASELALIANVSASYLSTKFKSETGFSLTQYITNTKVSKAKYYLQYTEMSIGEIASELGYQDIFYFSRVFRKQENISPSEFRKKFKQK